MKELKPLKSSLQIKIVTELLHLIRMMLSKLSKYFKNPNNTVLSLSLLSWLLPPHCSSVEFYQFGCKYVPCGWWIPTALMVFGAFLKLWLRQIWEQPLPQCPSARGDGPVLLCEFEQWFYPNSPLQGTDRMVILMFAAWFKPSAHHCHCEQPKEGSQQDLGASGRILCSFISWSMGLKALRHALKSVWDRSLKLIFNWFCLANAT